MASGIPFVTRFDSFLGVFSPDMPQLAVALLAAAVLPALIVGLVMRGRAQRAQAEAAAALAKNRTEADAAIKAEQVQAAARVDEANRKLVESTAKLADTEQRFATHREVADRRQTDASREISRLEAELTSVKEVAAQLAPTQARIKDLETALKAEQGRVQAQDQAIAATNARAVDFEKRMIEAQDQAARLGTAKQEVEAELKTMRDEQAARAAEGGPEAELVKAHEANAQLEVKIANLQRALKSTEARVEMVQKEFMNAVGLASAPTPGAPAAAAGDKRVRELEEKLALAEAESRKRAREDGYKIAELEYRLSEALESVAQPAPSAPAPLVEPAVAATDEEAKPEPALEPEAEIAPDPASEAEVAMADEPVSESQPEPEAPFAPEPEQKPVPTAEVPSAEVKPPETKPVQEKPMTRHADELPLGDPVA